MNCKACRIEIEDAQPGQTYSQSVGAHVASCTPCRLFQDEHSALLGMISDLKRVSAPGDFEFRLRARLAAVESTPSNRFGWNGLAHGTAAWALGASFLLLLAGAVFFSRWTPAPTSERPIIAAGVPLLSNSRSQPVSNASVPTVAVSVPESTDSYFTAENGARRKARSNVASSRSAVANDAGLDANTVASSSNDFAVVSPPPTVTPPGISDPITNPGAMTVSALPVRAATKFVTLNVNGGNGAPAKITLRPVTFGAQDLIVQGDAQTALNSTSQNIW